MDARDRPVLRSRAWPAAFGVLVVLLLVLATVGASPPAATIAVTSATVLCAVLVVGWALLRTRRQRQQYEDELTAWASERATQDERLRIARDLHDLASHGLGLITVRAAAARTLTGTDGDAERLAALTDIEQAGREATTELRRMLAVLRSPGDGTALQPAESLADLPRIVEFARTSGVRAELTVADLGEVTGGIQLTVCAIVREALANTARHAGPVRAKVAVRRDAGAIAVTVADDGPDAGWIPHPGAGAGLAGLRERVGAVGGTLRAGARQSAGFEVVAHLPDHQ
ncbi:histidine kinase [Kribbella antibiotica]|uniref:histidine kinase n=1 Tax=Kribbella antibiotica TaxID=190195 RepID=A0A4V2YQI6_9ACTN|nr:histidine kinase [Kribbella antibiotica]TDD62167.1 histidine kinase [Kribbella antibiotica]